jgi:hypothetical protein
MIGTGCGKLVIFAESLDQMHTPHQMVGIASDITVNVSQNIKEKIKRGEYVDLASLLTNNQHNDSKQKLILQQGELILRRRNCSSYIFQPRFAHRDSPNRTILIYFKSS